MADVLLVAFTGFYLRRPEAAIDVRQLTGVLSVVGPVTARFSMDE